MHAFLWWAELFFQAPEKCGISSVKVLLYRPALIARGVNRTFSCAGGRIKRRSRWLLCVDFLKVKALCYRVGSYCVLSMDNLFLVLWILLNASSSEFCFSICKNNNNIIHWTWICEETLYSIFIHIYTTLFYSSATYEIWGIKAW